MLRMNWLRQLTDRLGWSAWASRRVHYRVRGWTPVATLSYVQAIWLRLSNAFRVHGLAGTLYRVCRYPLLRILSARMHYRVFSSTETAEVFTRIYETNWWGCKESISGTGSTLAYTTNLREKLPELFKKLAVRKVFDAPCGDFNWMRYVVRSCDLDYLGCDIVRHLIDCNNAQYQNERIRFIVANVITDAFPKADIWICRDCLIHFSYNDILATFENFVRSEIDYLLTTTHINKSGFKNLDIRTGDARVIDLFSAPFFLPADYLDAIDDWQEPEVPRMMVLFGRRQILEALPKMRAALGRSPTSAA